MSIFLYIGAVAAVALGIGHSLLGERYVLTRLFRRQDLPKLFGSTEFTKRTLRFAWHITSIAWWGFAVLLAQLAHSRLTPSNAAQTIGWTFIASGMLPLFATRGRHLSWIVFFTIGTIALFAGR